MKGYLLEKIYNKYYRTKSKLFTILLQPCFYSVGEKTSISPPLRFANLSRISIGKNVTIHSNCWIQAYLKNGKDVTDPILVIKDYSSIGMCATISAAQSIIIEEYVFTARNVYISDHSHKYEEINCPISLQGIDKIAPVKIGKYTWLGQNACVMPGVTIGRHCVIGANSVVNKNIPDYSIAAGSPAKVIKKYEPKLSIWIKV